MMPLVSICIPAFNAEHTIKETLASVLGQTYPNFEVIVSDNASTDATVAVVESFNDPRIRISRNERNLGGGNIECCINLASGRYTAIFHADDVYGPDIISREVDLLERHPDVGAVFTSAQLIDDAGQVFSAWNMPPFLEAGSDPTQLSFAELFRALLRYENFLLCPSAMVRTSIYQQEIKRGYHERFGGASDLDSWLRIAKEHPIAVIPQRLMRYRRGRHNDTFHSNHLRTGVSDFFRVTEHYLALPEVRAMLSSRDLSNYQALVRRDLAFRACNAVIQGQRAEAAGLVREAFGPKLFGAALRNRKGLATLALWSAALGSLLARPLFRPLTLALCRKVMAS